MKAIGSGLPRRGSSGPCCGLWTSGNEQCEPSFPQLSLDRSFVLLPSIFNSVRDPWGKWQNLGKNMDMPRTKSKPQIVRAPKPPVGFCHLPTSACAGLGARAVPLGHKLGGVGSVVQEDPGIRPGKHLRLRSSHHPGVFRVPFRPNKNGVLKGKPQELTLLFSATGTRPPFFCHRKSPTENHRKPMFHVLPHPPSFSHGASNPFFSTRPACSP